VFLSLITTISMDPLFAPLDLPSGVFLLITDELAAPGDFFLHRTLASYLKRNNNGRAIIVALSESATRWKALASKSVSFSNSPSLLV